MFHNLIQTCHKPDSHIKAFALTLLAQDKELYQACSNTQLTYHAHQGIA
ncbi:MAG: hypothetical protein U9Q66_03465 [Patescibacteria group bacterium]|nr:hypothetical protein [Patescibacteria group bacterium]